MYSKTNSRVGMMHKHQVSDCSQMSSLLCKRPPAQSTIEHKVSPVI